MRDFIHDPFHTARASAGANVLIDATCAVCKKRFARTAAHAWKVEHFGKTLYLCSYTCMRKAQTEHERELERRKEARKKRKEERKNAR